MIQTAETNHSVPATDDLPGVPDDLPIEVKRQIVQEELQIYLRARYQMQLRYKINQDVGAGPEQLEAIRLELERLERILIAAKKELGKLA